MWKPSRTGWLFLTSSPSDSSDALPSQARTFDDYAYANGGLHWSARWFANALGYADYRTFRKGPIERAITACLTLELTVSDHFEQSKTADGLDDFHLTRYACYLVAMNADPKKTVVARAQGYFARMAEDIVLNGRENVERVLMRNEIGVQEKSLSSTISTRGVISFPLFHDAGYVGMYNMHLSDIKRVKGIPQDRSALDFMGSTELAANLFRITQTDEKIRNQAIHGQVALQAAATTVGETVRRTMIQTGGTAPEHLPAAGDIRAVRKGLKATSRNFKKIDQKRLQAPKKGR